MSRHWTISVGGNQGTGQKGGMNLPLGARQIGEQAEDPEEEVAYQEAAAEANDHRSFEQALESSQAGMHHRTVTCS